MSDSKSKPRGPAQPQRALQAALTESATDPVRRALWLDALEQQLRPCLPPALAPHCRLANVAGERLVFIVDSPVWRAKLRLAAAELLGAARSIGLTVTEVTVKISLSPLHPPLRANGIATPVSDASRKAIAAVLASLETPNSSGNTTPGSRRGGQKR
ncbi:MAG TPA: DciA family protein [Pseudoxanthomonas sp.]|nr:DciA family protein [Pseudoxanthomonas sp.]